MIEEQPNTVPSHIPDDLVFDFNIELTPGMNDQPFAVLSELQRTAPPIFYAPKMGSLSESGAWVLTRADDIREILQKPEFFTNTPQDDAPSLWPRKLIPLQIDPPDHTKYRVLIAPLFSPKAIDSIEAEVHRVTDNLIDRFAEEGQCEFLNDFARPLPTTIFVKMMGLPEEEADKFLHWNYSIIHPMSLEEAQQAGHEVAAYLAGLIEQRAAAPQDDIVSALVQAQVDGKPIEREIVEDMCMLLFMAGLDTVTSTLGFVFKYLAEHPDSQSQLRAEPSLIPQATEELLRLHPIVQTQRRLTQDTEFQGVTMKKGDQIAAWTALANYDPGLIDQPYSVDFQREPNPHLTFAAGVHRCAGSHLARREIRVAIERMTQRLPNFTVKPETQFQTHPQKSMLGLVELPLQWNAA